MVMKYPPLSQRKFSLLSARIRSGNLVTVHPSNLQKWFSFVMNSLVDHPLTLPPEPTEGQHFIRNTNPIEKQQPAAFWVQAGTTAVAASRIAAALSLCRIVVIISSFHSRVG
jgi:hypothetical protein